MRSPGGELRHAPRLAHSSIHFLLRGYVYEFQRGCEAYRAWGTRGPCWICGRELDRRMSDDESGLSVGWSLCVCGNGLWLWRCEGLVNAGDRCQGRDCRC